MTSRMKSFQDFPIITLGYSSASKGTWKVLKQAINKGPKMADISTVNYDSELVTDKNRIPEVFNDHFVGACEKLAKDISPSSCSSLDYILKVDTNGSRFEFKLLKPVDVYKVFSKLKNGKAAGMHLIPNRILKNVKDILTPSITDIFNASIKAKLFQMTSKLFELLLFLTEVRQGI